MIEWSELHEEVRKSVQRFIDAEVRPNLEGLEHGGVPPYEVLRKMVKTFGLDEIAKGRYAVELERAKAREAAIARGEAPAERKPKASRDEADEQRANNLAMQYLPIIELSKWSPGLVTALGISVGLTPSSILNKGTVRQIERWVLPLLTLEKIGAWAITEPDSGSDAFGSMKSTARRDGEGYVLNGSKTFITNGPYADTIVFICKLDDGSPPKERKVLTFVLDKGMPGLEQSKPLRKMGIHSSPTGQLFLQDVKVGKDRLLGESEAQPARSGTKESFAQERTGVVPMALGIVEQCRKLCIEYAKTRVQFGRPIGEFQLIQLKLAKMEVARMNIQNLVFRQIELASWGKSMSLAEASACKLYCAQSTMEVCLEAVQLFGGNGYMAEYHVEQLCRDAKVIQLYGGTDEIQISQIARNLLSS
jgi:alkylation response protein AidB-like acyl-CoA dehydrogenase